jgi:hypothetical protein
MMSNKNYVVCTSGRLSCEAPRAWEKVCFYEHIATQPSLLLRTVLPVPLRTTGAYRRVGDVSRCMYSDGGYLTKQITHIDDGKRIDFDVIEQTIRYAGRIVLEGGTIQIESHDDGTSSVHMLTRYELRWPAFLVPRFCIDFVVSAMHKIVIRDMQARLSSASSTSSSDIERPNSSTLRCNPCAAWRIERSS